MPGRSGARWFAPSSIPPILLLTFVTSFAFNHALVTTERRQQRRDHRIRTILLHDTIAYNSTRLYQLQPPSSSLLSRVWSRSEPLPKPPIDAEELESLVRRWRALGVNPFNQGLLPAADRPHDTHDGHPDQLRTEGPREIAWSEILFGNAEKRTSIKQRWHKVTAGIRDSFSQTPASPAHTQEPADDDKDLEELSRLWSSISKQ